MGNELKEGVPLRLHGYIIDVLMLVECKHYDTISQYKYTDEVHQTWLSTVKEEYFRNLPNFDGACEHDYITTLSMVDSMLSMEQTGMYGEESKYKKLEGATVIMGVILSYLKRVSEQSKVTQNKGE